MKETIIKIGIFTTVFIITYFLTKIIVNKKNKIHLKFMRSLTLFLIVAIGIISVLSDFEVFKNVATIMITSTTILVVTLGFCFQEAFANMIHGILISFSQTIDIGSRIKLRNTNVSGIVKDITLRAVTIKSIESGADLIIPNSTIDKDVIENFSDCFLHRYYFEYNCFDLQRGKKRLNEALSELGIIHDEILVVSLGEKIKIKVAIYHERLDDSFNMSSNLREVLYRKEIEMGVRK